MDRIEELENKIKELEMKIDKIIEDKIQKAYDDLTQEEMDCYIKEYNSGPEIAKRMFSLKSLIIHDLKQKYFEE